MNHQHTKNLGDLMTTWCVLKYELIELGNDKPLRVAIVVAMHHIERKIRSFSEENWNDFVDLASQGGP